MDQTQGAGHHHDVLGSVRNVTSAAGQTEWSYSYEPFGSARTETKIDTMAPDNTARFDGELLDADSGLYDLRARQYDSVSGRFLSLDPLPASGTHPYTARYAYANDSPAGWIDPSGLHREAVIDTSYADSTKLSPTLMGNPALAPPCSGEAAALYAAAASPAVKSAFLAGYWLACKKNRDHAPAFCSGWRKWTLVAVLGVFGGEELVLSGIIFRGVSGELAAARALSGWGGVFGTFDALWGLAQGGVIKGIVGLGALGAGGLCAAQ